MPPSSPARLRPGPRTRLALLAGTLGACFAAFLLSGLAAADVRDALEPAGVWAPLAFVPVATVLALALVPGWMLAAAAGLLFGPLLGWGTGLSAAVLTGVLALLIARGAGREGAAALARGRLEPVEAWMARRGLWAVAGARLAPGLPDAPCSYAAGLVGVAVWQMALGTALGSAPRAFAYSALGGSVDDLTSPLALAAAGVLAGTFVAGLLVVAHNRRRWTRSRAGS